MKRGTLLLVAALAAGLPGAGRAAARESLGVFDLWGAFRDEGGGRCTAMAQPVRTAPGKGDAAAFAAIATWPGRGLRGQFSARLSHRPAEGGRVYLSIGERRFALLARGGLVWAQDAAMDRAIVAALRATTTMSLEGRGRDGRPFSDLYALKGAATAVDAAALACAR